MRNLRLRFLRRWSFFSLFIFLSASYLNYLDEDDVFGLSSSSDDDDWVIDFNSVDFHLSSALVAFDGSKAISPRRLSPLSFLSPYLLLVEGRGWARPTIPIRDIDIRGPPLRPRSTFSSVL